MSRHFVLTRCPLNTGLTQRNSTFLKGGIFSNDMKNHSNQSHFWGVFQFLVPLSDPSVRCPYTVRGNERYFDKLFPFQVKLFQLQKQQLRKLSSSSYPSFRKSDTPWHSQKHNTVWKIVDFSIPQKLISEEKNNFHIFSLCLGKNLLLQT